MFKQISTPSYRTAPLVYYKAPPAGPSAERSSTHPTQNVFSTRDAGLNALKHHKAYERTWQ